MTKRWLSLVLVLTLLSTLFTGVAFAATSFTDGSITTAPADSPDTGRVRVTIAAPTGYPAGGSYQIYYNFGTSNVPDAASDNGSTLYTEPFVLDKAGTYMVKATAYVYKADGTLEGAYKATKTGIQVNTVAQSIAIN